KISGIVKTLNKNDILGLLYIQARECKDIELAKERFKASIQYDTNGNILTSYGFGAKMLCPKNSNWHNHLVLQAEKMLKHIPNADGFFFDNSWDKEYSDIINAIGELAHSKGLYFATNGASANCSAATDSIMAEGDTHTLKGLSYLALSQPIIFLPINHYNAYGYKGVVNEFGHKGRAMGLIDNFQNDLKECLINGAYYSYDWPGTDGYDKESKRIYKDYLPLENNLKGKKWYLIPHALKVPVNVKANIFENGKGELITYITSEGFPFCGKALAPFKVSIRVPGRLIKSALIRRIEDKKEIAIPFKQVTDTIEIEVSNHCSITMLKLK
ncbi:MAG: hypothetical protein U9O87_05765, partial [Verrucomicrobiota bacterium]|nr:hypothetical protein [Verrucomicrobiota bacterium]